MSQAKFVRVLQHNYVEHLLDDGIGVEELLSPTNDFWLHQAQPGHESEDLHPLVDLFVADFNVYTQEKTPAVGHYLFCVAQLVQAYVRAVSSSSLFRELSKDLKTRVLQKLQLLQDAGRRAREDRFDGMLEDLTAFRRMIDPNSNSDGRRRKRAGHRETLNPLRSSVLLLPAVNEEDDSDGMFASMDAMLHSPRSAASPPPEPEQDKSWRDFVTTFATQYVKHTQIPCYGIWVSEEPKGNLQLQQLAISIAPIETVLQVLDAWPQPCSDDVLTPPLGVLLDVLARAESFDAIRKHSNAFRGMESGLGFIIRIVFMIICVVFMADDSRTQDENWVNFVDYVRLENKHRLQLLLSGRSFFSDNLTQKRMQLWLARSGAFQFALLLGQHGDSMGFSRAAAQLILALIGNSNTDVIALMLTWSEEWHAEGCVIELCHRLLQESISQTKVMLQWSLQHHGRHPPWTMTSAQYPLKIMQCLASGNNSRLQRFLQQQPAHHTHFNLVDTIVHTRGRGGGGSAGRGGETISASGWGRSRTFIVLRGRTAQY